MFRRDTAATVTLGNGARGADDESASRLFDQVREFMLAEFSLGKVTHDTDNRLQNKIKVLIHSAFTMNGDAIAKIGARFPGTTFSNMTGHPTASLRMEVPLATLTTARRSKSRERTRPRDQSPLRSTAHVLMNIGELIGCCFLLVVILSHLLNYDIV
jgi:hypothetical protein